MASYCPSPAQLVVAIGGGPSLDFMDSAGGFRVASFELAFPTVRELLYDLPISDGAYDATRLLGPRVVTIAGSLIASSRGSRGAALGLLAPFLDPAARPSLTYQVDADQVVRTIGLRSAALSAPFTNPSLSAFTASWKAPNPASYATTLKTATTTPGVAVTATNGGNFRTPPRFRMTGPLTNPVVQATSPVAGTFAMLYTTLTAGQYIDADMGALTVVRNDGTDLFNVVDFTQTTWPVLAAGANTVTFNPATSSAGAGLTVSWYDAYL